LSAHSTILAAGTAIATGRPVRESADITPILVADDRQRAAVEPSTAPKRAAGGRRSHGRWSHADGDAQSAAVDTRDRVGDVGPMLGSCCQALLELDAVGPADGEAVDDVAWIFAAEDVVGARDPDANV
jgi:hypothetical protein